MNPGGRVQEDNDDNEGEIGRSHFLDVFHEIKNKNYSYFSGICFFICVFCFYLFAWV